ncbi:MAG: hypothetical protein Sw2PiMacB_15490 [Shewanella algae]
MPANQDGTAGDYAATEHSVKFDKAAGDPWHFVEIYLIQRLDLTGTGAGITAELTAPGWRGRPQPDFGNGIPFMTGTALPLPAGKVLATFVAHVCCFILRHLGSNLCKICNS